MLRKKRVGASLTHTLHEELQTSAPESLYHLHDRSTHIQSEYHKHATFWGVVSSAHALEIQQEIMETKSEVSIDSSYADSLTNSCVQNLP